MGFTVWEAVVPTALEREMQSWCAKEGIYFQAFWTLEANIRIMLSTQMQALAEKYAVSPRVLYLRYMMGIGIVPVIKNTENMKADVSSLGVPLTSEDAAKINDLFTEASSG